MTETKTDLGNCIMGASTKSPCRYPATVELPRKLGTGVGLCLFHAATEGLYEEIDELSMALEMLKAYLKGARKNESEPLITVLERAEADFTRRRDVIQHGLDQLEAAEYKLMR